MRLPRAARVLVLSVPLLLAACGGGDDGDVPEFPTVVSLGEGVLFPSIINSALAVGPNRVVIQVVDEQDERVLDATVRVRYFDLNGRRPVLSSEADARIVRAELSFIDENAGREPTVTGEGGVYVTPATFDAPGDWGAEITVTQGDKRAVVPYRFTVLADTPEPGVGDPAPPSQQETTATSPIEDIDSSAPPRTSMHGTTVADALATGKPIVVTFATPAFCASRLCAPVLDLAVDPLAERYGNDATFIHIEPYRLADLRSSGQRNPVPAALEWRIRSEPWVFVVGRDGRVVAKFEGLVAIDEIEGALRAALGEAAG